MYVRIWYRSRLNPKIILPVFWTCGVPIFSEMNENTLSQMSQQSNSIRIAKVEGVYLEYA
jgi:hypothetical protein